MRVGVLALQGDFAAHTHTLSGLGIHVEPIRTRGELDNVDGLVLPGGESSAMLRLMERDRLDLAIVDRVTEGMPVLATCAGVILLARHVVPRQRSLGLLDVEVTRNAYGRQIRSAVRPIELNGSLGPPPRMEAVFIRAPRIDAVGSGVRVFGTLDDDPVLVAADNIIAATFHPELSGDRRVHELYCRQLEASHV